MKRVIFFYSITIFVLIIFSFKKEIKEPFNSLFPIELIKNECYLIDTITIDTLYINKIFFKKKRKEKQFDFFVCSDSFFIENLTPNQFVKNKRINLFSDVCSVVDFLLSKIAINKYTNKNDTLNFNPRGWKYYRSLYDSCYFSQNQTPYNYKGDTTILLNSHYYVFLIRANLIDITTTEGDFNIKEYNNCYFKMLCPIFSYEGKD